MYLSTSKYSPTYFLKDALTYVKFDQEVSLRVTVKPPANIGRHTILLRLIHTKYALYMMCLYIWVYTYTHKCIHSDELAIKKSNKNAN